MQRKGMALILVLMTLLASITAVAYYISVNHANREPSSPTDSSALPTELWILSPENKTYQTAKVSLNFAVTESASGITYALDEGENITVAGNQTLSGLCEGTHKITFYAFDNEGKLGDTENVVFAVVLPKDPDTKPVVQQIEETIRYFESEGFTVEVKDPDKPQNWLNKGVVNLETKEALATFAHQQGIKVIYQFNNPNSVSFSAYVYSHGSPLPTIYYFHLLRFH